jgi:hypothetical protein
MNMEEYSQQALLTESKINTATLDKTRLIVLLKVFIAAGNLLDFIKKDAFYGPPTDNKKLVDRNSIIFNNELALITAAAYFAPSVTDNPHTQVQIDTRMLHGIIGIATEAVELAETLHSSLTEDVPFDKINILEEVADCVWYQNILVDACGSNWDQVLQANLSKLAARNQGKQFNASSTIDRNTDQERKILEQVINKSPSE